MNKFIKGLRVALLFGAAIFVSASSASAVTVNDTVGGTGAPYIGGNPSGTSSWDGRDVVGNYDVFAIHSMEVTRTGTLGNDLTVVVNTNFAGQQDTSDALGMDYGALFIGTSIGDINFTDTTVDTYNGDKDRFQYAFDMNYNPGSGDQNGTGTLWALDQDAGDLGKDVEQSTVSSGTFREEQAWRPYTENNNPATISDGEQNASSTGLTGTWTVEQGSNAPNLNMDLNKNAALDGSQTGLIQGDGYIQFVISDFFGAGSPVDTSGPNLVLAWAMQCANDVILAVVPTNQLLNPVPLPGGLIPLLSGLLGVGWLGRSRARQA